MSNFVIISDSACDLPEDLRKEYDIDIVPFYISFDKENYLKEGIDISNNDFYDRIISEKILPKTSLPSMDDYINCFKKHLDNGFDILCFNLSSNLSGSHQSATNAASISLDEYPERKIIVIDSKKATVLQGLYVLQAAKMRKSGLNLEETYKKTMDSIDEGTIIFTVDTLEYLEKGGRIGKAASLAGSLLNIKPILIFHKGALEPHSKVRGRKKSKSEILRICYEYIKDNPDKYDIAIGHSNCRDEALELEQTFKEKYGLSLSFPVFDIGITIGAHTGPTTIGIGFIKKI